MSGTNTLIHALGVALALRRHQTLPPEQRGPAPRHARGEDFAWGVELTRSALAEAATALPAFAEPLADTTSPATSRGRWMGKVAQVLWTVLVLGIAGAVHYSPLIFHARMGPVGIVYLLVGALLVLFGPMWIGKFVPGWGGYAAGATVARSSRHADHALRPTRGAWSNFDSTRFPLVLFNMAAPVAAIMGGVELSLPAGILGWVLGVMWIQLRSA